MSHEDKVFFGNFIGVLAVLVIIAVVFFFLADTVTDDIGTSEEDNARMQEKVAENIAPVGQVNVGEVQASAAPAAAAGPRPGDQVYNAACMACHSTGAAGAPKAGDSAAWSPRAAKGIDGLLASAISGMNAMPPRGGCADCSDDELKSAIEYILKESGQ